ncbi:MAG: hypothetical protein JWM28_1545 [Chitinophagaceae bacterium]|nr:hypothetical protein [Chitinophagaceae bacterium]
MEDHIKDLENVRKEYDQFMSWFRENHLEFFEKYAENISAPFRPGGGIKINSNNNIGVAEQDELYKIANSFYQIKDLQKGNKSRRR